MNRRLFSFAAAVSLLVLMATAMLWAKQLVRVILLGDLEAESKKSRVCVLRFDSGTLTLYWIVRPPPPPPVDHAELDCGQNSAPLNDVTFILDRFRLPRDLNPMTRLGFGYFGDGSARHVLWGVQAFYMIGAPCWFLVLILALLPAARMWNSIRLSRRATDSCIACFYNLTGNTSGICPECGSAIPEADRMRL